MKKLNIKQFPKDYPTKSIWKGETIETHLSPRWMFGQPLWDDGQLRMSELSIGVYGPHIAISRGVEKSIDPATLSQCIGKADCNGDLYFIGDVAVHPNGCRIVIKKDGTLSGYIELIDTNPDWLNWDADFSNLHEAEIIGTIHETNP